MVQNSKFVFVGNRLCLDFLNTELVEKGTRVDLLGNYVDLTEWLFEAGVLEAKERREITARWSGQAGGASALDQALRFRAGLREMIEGIVKGKPAGKPAVEEINRVLRHQNEYTYVNRENGDYQMKLRLRLEAPIHLLVPIAKSAAEILHNADFSRIKKCENPDCILYYYDTSKNQTRRWCSMNFCGNRMKAAAHYERKKRQAL